MEAAKRKTFWLLWITSAILLSLPALASSVDVLHGKTRAELSAENGQFSVERQALNPVNATRYYDWFGEVASDSPVAPNRTATGQLVDQINGPGQRLAGQIDEVARRRALGLDPASGRYRVLEEQAALRLEQRVGRLRRDPSGTCDWLDAAGRSYDAVGPVPAQHIDTDSFINQINRHLNKQGLYRVVVDLTGFNSAQRRAVFNHLRTLDQSQLGRILIQRTR